MNKFILTVTSLLVALIATAQDKTIYERKGLAIDGYDPVAYFEQGEAVKGTDSLSAIYGGSRWLFSSAKNRDLFQGNPQKYIPQYGGYCAYAISQNHYYKSDPRVWAIIDGKLYLNFSPKIQKKWEGQRTNYIEQANKNWPELIKNKE